MNVQQKTLTIFGATGSVGSSTLDLVRKNPDRFKIHGLTAHTDVEGVAALVEEFHPAIVVMSDARAYVSLTERLSGHNVTILSGAEGLDVLATQKVDLVVAAIVGLAGLRSVSVAVQAGQKIALANKEALVAAGHLVMPDLKRFGGEIIPIDSEHNAIFQCLIGENKADISRITLTASGGPFRDYTIAELQQVTISDALNHPNWDMGAKISVDSASMMNKGLELIEAFWLFDVHAHQLEAVIHPQSVIHGMVGYCDGSWLAHLGIADMRVPISYALGHPDRLAWKSNELDLIQIGQFNFRAIDYTLFPCFKLAKQVIGTNPANAVVLNAANEAAVALFLEEKIHFTAIAGIVEDCLSMDMGNWALNSIDDVIALDIETRKKAQRC